MEKNVFDAIVVGAGPNGLAAAITLQRAGLSVLLLESKDTVGGGMRTQQLTLPGFYHDVCSAIHPMAMASPFFASLPLQDYGLEFVHSPLAAAHPFDDGHAAFLSRSLEDTAAALGVDKKIYTSLIAPISRHWEAIAADSMGPFRLPRHPLIMADFGRNALLPAAVVAARFSTPAAKGLWAGMAGHAIQPLTNWTTAAIALVLCAVGHRYGWPVPKGGSQAIAQAMAAYFTALGGEIRTRVHVTAPEDLPSHRAVLFDVTPRQLLAIAGDRFTPLYRCQLSRYRYGAGIFKIDWALQEPIPFKAAACRQAATVHLGNTFEEIAFAEQQVHDGKHPANPFVLLAQQSLFDQRAPAGRHTAWAYCHVPNGSVTDMTSIIEKQVERFAPGFRDIILDKHTMNTHEMEAYNPNYVGGDINGGIMDIRQLYTRPVLSLSPYRTSAKGMYICSSATPPGGGVHGMCGYHAAKAVLKDLKIDN
ncbi:phytoene desaturase family protein [Chitinophaga nivalis]|uniref:Pyridine nucleotide-disulfide oxidoreductase domain-containing protein 2 n=1 Tax=Chitinophaga nivalis TaxID=2991709 RepID=A0ABT3IGL7_9BACT|nr:NAD(P)/FAD-dependent oxidoreductase [Chitinophaga nivalis]MCW3467206.1 NAD(P)/FAD-dependent oxidoreductase [Chitinophaga nivalis]MCW3483102.1 NAD(P)/FAD-dependent oxidoreductase [Chitinophaga nivalis]